MKKHFYSLWFRVVIIFFWAMVTTVLVMGVLLHLMRGTFLWNFFPFTGLGFLAVLAVACILLGTLISVAIAHHVMNPVSELTRAMQKVAAGDYTVKLESGRYIGELADLYHNFNQMVQELNSTEISERIGFSSARYFAKCFKDVYHISPLAYRKGEEGKEEEEAWDDGKE